MRRTTALLPYFGCNRTLAAHVGAELAGCRFVCVPFAGGMPELLHLSARTLLVGDLNRHAINLAQTLARPHEGAALVRRLRRLAFHPDALAAAQGRCRAVEAGEPHPFGAAGWAEDYFVCCWMGRNGTAGTGKELTGGLSVRWDAGGGDGATRFRSATEGLRAWRAVMPRCTFQVRDCFDLLADVKDEAGVGVYADPPWPDDGDRYAHRFTGEQQRRLAARLADFRTARVVVRYGDHPLVRELYPEGAPWRWVRLAGRTAHAREMGGKAEVLIVNGGEAA